MGLESLIPNKNGQQHPQSNAAFAQQQGDDPIVYDADEGKPYRQERDGLGVLDRFGWKHDAATSQPAVSFEPALDPLPPQPQPAPVREERSAPSSQASHVAPARDVGDIPVISGPIFHVETEKIEINPYQPRKEFDDEALKELAASIREFGILQPLVVTKQESETEYGTKVSYQLIAGHRRLLASKLVGLKTVPVVIRNSLKRTEALEMAIVENIQRRDLNVIETARAYARLSDEFGLTQREIAVRLGKSREAIANALRLLALPTDMQDALSAGKINESHARLLLQVQDPILQKEIFNDITMYNLSVRDIKRRIEGKKKAGRPMQPASAPVSAEFRSMEKEISDTLGAPVHVEYSQNGGKIIIHFYSPEEARGIIQKMMKEQQF